MNGWTWKETINTENPLVLHRCVMEKADRGARYVFETQDGENWTATITRASGHDPVTEPVTWEHMMELKAIAEKP